MAAPIKPAKKASLGRDSYWLVPAIADLSAPTATEVNAATGINITCFLLNDQEGLTGTTERVTLPMLLCETSTSEGIGTTTFSMADLRIVLDPQADSSHNDKKAFEKIRDGYTGFVVRRQNVDALSDGAVATGQFVDAAPIQIGLAIPGKSSNDASGIYTATAAVAVTGTPALNVEVVAGA